MPTRPRRARRAPAIHFSETAGLRHLHVGGTAIQSAMLINAPNALALAYTRAMMACLLFRPEPRRVLLIGLGGGSLAKFIHRHLPRAQVAAIEVDARVVDAAHSLFGLPLGKPRLRVFVGDGADYVARHPRSADLILLDAFVNHRQAPSIRTEAFYRAARRALAPGGVLTINYMSDDPGIRAYVRRLAIAFEGRMVALRAIGEDNIIVFAFRDDPGTLQPEHLVGRAAALQRSLGLEFQRFAAGLRSPHRVRIAHRALLPLSELRRIRS